MENRLTVGKECGTREVVRLLQGSKDMMLVARMAGGIGVARRDQNEGRTSENC